MPSASDSLRIALNVPGEVGLGEIVRIRLLATNVTEDPLDVYLLGRAITFDLVVTDEDGSEVWSRLEGEVIPSILQIRTLAPNETLPFEDTWDQRSNDGRPVPPGTYGVHGELPTEGEPLRSADATLRILRR